MNHGDFDEGFHYIGEIYRPPQEADSMLIQVTVGCSHGKCTFCHGYKERPFSLKDRDILERDFRYGEEQGVYIKRVFLLDGNALCMPMERWEWVLENIRTRLPWVEEISCFGTALDIAAKSDEDLGRLRKGGLTGIYVGVESGHDDILRRIHKGVDGRTMLAQLLRAKRAGFRVMVTILLGIAGRELSLAHARATGQLLSALAPDDAAVMNLLRLERTGMDDKIREGEQDELTPQECLHELRELLVHTHMDAGVFHSWHASNYLSLRAAMPHQKAEALEHINRALAGQAQIKPNKFRRL